MFWADKISRELKERGLPLEWVDDMKTPSGKIHIGSLRGVVIHDLIYKALKEHNVNVKYTYIFDNHDPMDDLPVYLPKEKFEQYLGMPLYKIPSPVDGYSSYAEYYAKDFQNVFNAIGCNPEILWTTDLYKSRKMNDLIKESLDRKDEIKAIYEEMYKKTLPSEWYPFQIYCTNCGKVSTTQVAGWDGAEVTFTCYIDRLKWAKGCGFSGKVSPFSDEKEIRGKLPWKIEWPAKWKVLGITVEGAGKDHMSAGGSHDLATLICERIFKYTVPYPIAYEFFLVGGKKMSSSKGRGFSASEMLEILPPEILRFIMVKTRVNQAIDFDPSGSETIPNLFDEYQEAADNYFEKKNEDLARIFELSQIDKIEKPPALRFKTLAQWVQMPNMEQEIKKEGLEKWAKYARVWVDEYAPESERFLVQEKLPDQTKNLSAKQKEYLKKLSDMLDNTKNAEELQAEIYNLSKDMNIPSKDVFSAIYIALLGKDHGPKAAWLLQSLDKEFIKKRLQDASV